MNSTTGPEQFARRFEAIWRATWKVFVACVLIEVVIVFAALLLDLPTSVRAVLLVGSVLLLGAIMLTYILVKGTRTLRQMDQPGE